MAEPKNDNECVHLEQVASPPPPPKFIVSQGGGDTALALFSDPSQPYEPLSTQEAKKLDRKIDWVILPYISVAYAFFYIDKTTLSYAAIFGIQEDLNLHGTQYSWLSSVFYFGFLVWAIPTNLALQRFPVARYLGANIFAWGALLMAQAAARNFIQLAVLRALSGAAEACADPAFLLITSMWYTRKEQPLKIGLWYTANGFGVALGGLLGYGIGQIKGALPSWKYEFLIIGALCCAWGIVMYVFLPDSPVSAKGFSLAEKRTVVERLREDQTGVENKNFKGYQVLEAFMDYKLYLQFLISLMQSLVNGGISNFGTIIIKGFGFSTLGTTLMQIPYGAIIAISILLCIYLNRILPPNNRCLLLVAFLLPNVAGAFGLRYVPQDNRAGRLICYYLTAPINASFVLLLSLQTANTAGHTKKVINSACLFLGYCVGNIAGPFFYKSEQSPTYILGIWSMIVSHLLEIVVVFVLRFLLARENKERDKLQGIDGVNVLERELHEQDVDASAFGDLTDKENLNFRYIY
ncbi:MFS general substrate transporter [Aspergillus affinis]|uniref:MFS general substrate transporter n=1 Tax=Aspergillus affinis TaxID=1070780 RepID=UPI0022FDB2A2|nr:MFS general substrate transporter [Aspergillus affinis]KAI9035728.1 MFS general substrate transporter [Aspergillus affinis]